MFVKGEIVAAKPSSKRRRRSKKKGPQTETGAKAPLAEARFIVQRGIRHPDPNKRLDPNIVDLRILEISICVVIGK